jgi:hypothetical protein
VQQNYIGERESYRAAHRMSQRSRLELERQLTGGSTKGDDSHKADLGLQNCTRQRAEGMATQAEGRGRWHQNPSLESPS